MEKLNNYLADLVVSYLKLHDLHWNVKGRQFVEVHKYTEGLYEDFAEKFDAVAERMIMEHVKPISNIKDYLAHASIKEVSEVEYRDGDVLAIVLADLKALKEECLSLRAHFEEIGKIQVVNLLDSHVEFYDKEIWFLESMTK